MIDFVLSPSLQTSAEDLLPAYEMKFLLTEAEAERVTESIRSVLHPDPHGTGGSVPGEYLIATIYCDTPDFDVYRRNEGYARRKYRVRRYNRDGTVFLERKTRKGNRVRKQRINIPLSELTELNHSKFDINWPADWFRQETAERQLSPTIQVSYRRQAFVGAGPDGPLRVTFDRDLRSVPINHWFPDAFAAGASILTDCVICEFKFRGSMPMVLKSLVEAHSLVPSGASKYRRSIETVGMIFEKEIRKWTTG